MAQGYIIFAIDNDKNQQKVSHFMSRMKILNAMQKMGPLTMLIGSYKGVLEQSYMIEAQDRKHIEPFIEGQDSILHVPASTRQPCHLEYLQGDTPTTEKLGPMRTVSAEKVLQNDAWTYNPKLNMYFTC
jgi:hypothetical protein